MCIVYRSNVQSIAPVAQLYTDHQSRVDDIICQLSRICSHLSYYQCCRLHGLHYTRRPIAQLLMTAGFLQLQQPRSNPTDYGRVQSRYLCVANQFLYKVYSHAAAHTAAGLCNQWNYVRYIRDSDGNTTEHEQNPNLESNSELGSGGECNAPDLCRLMVNFEVKWALHDFNAFFY